MKELNGEEKLNLKSPLLNYYYHTKENTPTPENGGEKLAKEFNLKLLGKIPFHSVISKNCDAGTPELIHNDSSLNKIYLELSESLIN